MENIDEFMLEIDPSAESKVLTDRSHRTFCVEQNGHEFAVFNETPFSLVDHLDELKTRGARCFRIDLSYGALSPEIVRSIISGRSVSGHTGNFDRRLQ